MEARPLFYLLLSLCSGDLEPTAGPSHPASNLDPAAGSVPALHFAAWCRGLNTYERDGDAPVTPARQMFGDGTPIQHRVGHQIRFAVSGFSCAFQRVLTPTCERLGRAFAAHHGGVSFIMTCICLRQILSPR